MDTDLLARLESSRHSGLLPEITAFLYPFADLIAAQRKRKNKTAKKTTKNREIDQQKLRSLSKQFFPFISRLLKLCSTKLSKKNCEEEEGEGISDLFEIFKLAVDCLYCISPCLAGKPYSVHLQRYCLIWRLEVWERFVEAEEQCLFVLESLRSETSLPSMNKKEKRPTNGSEYSLLLPECPENADPELSGLVADIVAVLIKCCFKSKTKEIGSYRRILSLVDQVQPWLRVLSSETPEKYRGNLFMALYQCTLFILGESTYFDDDLLHRFCMMTLNECLRSSTKDHFTKIAYRFCYSLAPQWAHRFPLMLDILRLVLESISCECKIGVVCTVNEILDLVNYCSCKCRGANIVMCKAAAKLLIKFASDFLKVFPPVASILRLYATGLCLMDNDISGGHKSLISKPSNGMPHNGEDLEHLADLLGSLALSINNYNNKDACTVSFVASKFQSGDSISCTLMHGEATVLSYLNALEFLCVHFADYLDTEWRNMISKNEVVPFSDNIDYVLDAFYLFCDGFHIQLSNASAMEKDMLNKSRRSLLSMAMAAFRISLMRQHGTQRSIDCVDRVISREWIQSQELKYLISSLYNVGVSMYNTKQYEMASMAMKLCYRASWTHVSQLCKSSEKSVGIDKDILSEAVADSVTDACAKSAIFLDVLHRCGNPIMKEIIVDSLLNWSDAQSNLNPLTCPLVLVTQWVKIVCKDFKDVDLADDALMLYSLLSNACRTCPNKMLCVILEQELSVYAELGSRHPSFCQSMEERIIDALLNIYVGIDYYFQRSRVLVRKSRIARASGCEGLKCSILCLSDAISILKPLVGEALGNSAPFCHQLALIYCLHALCTQEADPNSEVILCDINCALKLWSSIDISDPWFQDDHHKLVTDNELPLLHHTADLLSLKGYLPLQYEIYKLIIVLSKRKNITLAECLTMLWGDRRLNHALCASPIDENLISKMSKQFGVPANSIEFWTSCIEGSPVLLIGFCQKVLLSNSLVQGSRCHPERPSFSDISIEEINDAASSLITTTPGASRSAFIAGYLYYDLCERLYSNGQLLEALSYSRKAFQLRMKLLQRTFSVKMQSTEDVENSETNRQNQCGITQLEAVRSVTSGVWPEVAETQKFKGSILSPWNALKCYLESAMQVGIIYESIGNGDDAESIFLMGKKISCLQGLPLFGAAFGSVLGQIYRKKQLWELAENELHSAKQILVTSSTTISCKRCRLSIEITLDMQIGDLMRSRLSSTAPSHSIKGLSCALDMYTTALGKLESDYEVACSDVKVAEIGSLKNIISSKFKFQHARLLIRLLIQIAKCMWVHGEIHKVHELFWQIISLLFSGRSPSEPDTSPTNYVLLEFIGEGCPGNMFTVEHAAVLYHISLFSLKICISEHSRTLCCTFSDIQLPRIVVWLRRAFVLCREMPLLFQKVSRLLSAIHLLSTSGGPLSLPVCSDKHLSACHWAAYFHQASLGTYLHHQHLSILRKKIESSSSTSKDSNVASSSDVIMETCNSLRFAPEKLDDLEGFVTNFFQCLPNVTVVCISLLGGCLANLLAEILRLSFPSFPAWILLSHLNSKRQPVVMLLPVDLLYEETLEDDACSGMGSASTGKESSKKWHCPWSHTLVAEVARGFKLIMEETYLSATTVPTVDTNENRYLWWTQRSRLDIRLGRFLENVEDSWFGSWRCLLLGEPKDRESLESRHKKLLGSLRRRFKFDGNESLLRLVLASATSCSKLEDCVTQFLLYKGWLGMGGCWGEERSVVLPTPRDREGELLKPRQLILDAIRELSDEWEIKSPVREPVVLVLDADVQMLPWESLPVLRKHEVYRMPSVGSISATLNRRRQYKEQAGSLVATFPSIDPLDAYYLLNPSGDLDNTQAGFEDWFRELLWEGKAGTVPTAEELSLALQKHDLFLYFGHGSGEQYLRRNKIEELDCCAAALLMGCSSGKLTLPGCYAPKGVILSYLLAGCPAVIANLWDVTDKDINRFSKVLINAWLEQRTTRSQAVGCTRGDRLAEQFGSMELRNKGNGKAKRPSRRAPRGKGKVEETSDKCTCRDCCNDGLTIATSMGQARDACKLQFLVGTAPVCYGVPTIIQKKKD